MSIRLPAPTIIKNMFYIYASLILNHFLRAIYLVAIARILGADIYGLLAYGQTWYMAFLPFTTLGLGTLLVRKLAVDRIAGAKLARQIFAIQIISVIALTAACILLGFNAEDDSRATQLLLIFSIALLARGFCQWSDSMFIAYEKPREKLNIDKYIRSIEVTLGITIAYITQNVVFVAISHALMWSLQAAIQYRVVNAKLLPITPDFSYKVMGGLVFKALPMGASIVLNAIVVPLVIISYKSFGANNSEIANFSIDMQAFVILLAVFAAIAQASGPALRRSMLTGNDKLITYAVYFFRLSVAYGFFAVIAAELIGEIFINAVLGKGYALAGQYLDILMYALIPSGIITASLTVFNVLGKFYLGLIVNAIGVIVTTLMLYVFLTKGDYQSALLAMLFGYVVASIFAVVMLANLLKWAYVKRILSALCVLILLVGYGFFSYR